ncbi:hypothetical protein V1478_011715 [Vespula squamosa]|uniref:Uncharacterized protein n=1 Tax=Vespula squamosa TaxID=30214 RepID=A0ABD2AB43_VESSQ
MGVGSLRRRGGGGRLGPQASSQPGRQLGKQQAPKYGSGAECRAWKEVCGGSRGSTGDAGGGAGVRGIGVGGRSHEGAKTPRDEVTSQSSVSQDPTKPQLVQDCTQWFSTKRCKIFDTIACRKVPPRYPGGRRKHFYRSDGEELQDARDDGYARSGDGGSELLRVPLWYNKPRSPNRVEATLAKSELVHLRKFADKAKRREEEFLLPPLVARCQDLSTLSNPFIGASPAYIMQPL